MKPPSGETLINCFFVGANCVRPPKICEKQVFSGKKQVLSGERSSPLRAKCDLISVSPEGALVHGNRSFPIKNHGQAPVIFIITF